MSEAMSEERLAEIEGRWRDWKAFNSGDIEDQEGVLDLVDEVRRLRARVAELERALAEGARTEAGLRIAAAELEERGRELEGAEADYSCKLCGAAVSLSPEEKIGDWCAERRCKGCANRVGG